MPTAGHASFTTVRFLVSVFVLAAMLFSGMLVAAQETTQPRGAIKGTVALVNQANHGSTPEGFLLELKPFTDGSPYFTAMVDATGNYEFKDLPEGDYLLQLQREGFEPFKAALHVRSGAPIVQDISLKLAGLSEKVEVKEQAEPLSTTTSSTPRLNEK